ncbi:IclR family transcriptional regulator [Candidatus Aerophobetes bacterium]|nr:IclR family transcriptional regulator [Candidatus Aerophobetes bacterium]
MEDPKYPLKTLSKSLLILETLAQPHSPTGIGELSRKLGISRSTVHRILDTLRSRGYVEKDPSTLKYRLGSKILELAMAKLEDIELIKEASLYLKELLKQCNETVHLAVLDRGEVLYLDKKESAQAIRIVSRVGGRLPAHCTGLGKVLLAYSDRQTVKEIIKEKGLHRFTKNTITNEAELIRELDKIREQGFAEDNEEIEEGLCCIAAPVRDHSGKVIAAISVSGPKFRMVNKYKECKEAVIRTAEKISMQLGYKCSK